MAKPLRNIALMFFLCYHAVAQEGTNCRMDAFYHFQADTVGGFKTGEILIDLFVNPEILKKNDISSNLSKGFQVKNYFLLDTVKLPFIDDFSADFFKSHDTSKYNIGLVTDSVAYGFFVDGLYRDTLVCSTDSTWSYVFNPADSSITKTILAQVQVVFFNDFFNPFVPSDTTYCWPAFNVFDTTGIPSPDTIAATDSLTTTINKHDTLKVYPPDTGANSLWMDNSAFLNTTYPVNPVTVGVATLDGVNELGRPYDFSNPQSYGIADHLTSKPIDLNYAPGDSLYFSFFYQPQGRGNDPQPEDSLLLEFYSPSMRKWNTVWSMPGSPNQDFKQVMIPLNNPVYLEKGFHFRFTNYATLSGNLDHWHIDYVRLYQNRTFDDTVIVDVAFAYNSGSFLKNYQAIPWKHFLADTIAFLADSMTVVVRNNDTTIKNITPYQYTITGGFDSAFVKPFSLSSNVNPFYQSGYRSFVSPIEYTCFSPSFNCFTPASDSAVFEVTNILATTPDVNRGNDTVRYFQKFFNYYAYDDGSAEQGYGLVSTAGAMLAYRFALNRPDTLRAVMMYFNQQLVDVSQKIFYLTLWNEINNKPGNIIYQEKNHVPVYEDSLNKFHTYVIDSALVLNGVFYVGWVQTTNDVLNIGFDVNTIANASMFFNVTGLWQQSIIPGSWMIRPVFGAPIPITSGLTPQPVPLKKQGFEICPNPANNRLYYKISDDDEVSSEHCGVSCTIYDVLGRIEYFCPDLGCRNYFIDISGITQGIYFVRMDDLKRNNSFTRKLLIRR